MLYVFLLPYAVPLKFNGLLRSTAGGGWKALPGKAFQSKGSGACSTVDVSQRARLAWHRETFVERLQASPLAASALLRLSARVQARSLCLVGCACLFLLPPLANNHCNPLWASWRKTKEHAGSIRVPPRNRRAFNQPSGDHVPKKALQDSTPTALIQSCKYCRSRRGPRSRAPR